MENTIKIAVCEDTQRDKQLLVSLLHQYIEKNLMNMKIDCFESGEELLGGFEKGKYHLIFLDIYLQGNTGVEIAKILRDQDPEVIIIFTTISRDHALDAFYVRAIHYLVKPLTADSIEDAFGRIKVHLDALFEENAKTLDVIVDRNKISIPLKDIIYIDVYHNNRHIHTRDNVYTTYTSIEEIQDNLPSPPFFRCHRCYIVNISEVKSLKTDFVMSNGDVVYVRQSERKKMMDVYSDYLLKIDTQGDEE